MPGTELAGKVALVTGAASGIGREIALQYAAEGARVVATDVNNEGGEATATRIRDGGGEALFLALDTTDEVAQKRVVAEAVAHFGALHVACNAAGISVGPSKSYERLADVATSDWKQIVEVNLYGLFFGMREQIPAILASGGGSIINIASIMGLVGRATLTPYVSSKHGVVGLTKVAALDYAQQGVRINAIAPGYVDTPILVHRDAAARDALAADHALKRLGQASEIAELALWLASDRSSFVTGACYPVDGGYTAR